VSESSHKATTSFRRQPPDSQKRPQRATKQGQIKGKRAPVKGATQPPAVKKTSALARPTVSVTPVKRGVAQTVKVSADAKGKISPFKPSDPKFKTVRGKKQGLPKKMMRSRKTRMKPMARTILYALRLLIVGVGIGALVGTVLSVLDPATRLNTAGVASETTVGQQAQLQQSQNTQAPASTFQLTQEIPGLKNAVVNLAAQNQNLTPGVFLVDLDTGGYVDMNGGTTFSAASTIKFPILVAFFQDVDGGKIRLDEMLTMEQRMVAGGSGEMQFKKVGTQFSALETATQMITISDNTATNMLIAKLGGIEVLNQRFRSWGLITTGIRNFLPDLEGTNTTSPKDLGNLMAMVSKGNLISMPSRDRLLDIMRRTVKDTLLPSGLGTGASIAHKTGDIGTVLADTGLIDMPTGKRYLATVMIKRPNNDIRAEKLITSISQAAYQQFSQGATMPTTGIQSPVMSPPPNSMGNTMPSSGYQSPVMSPSSGMGSTMPSNGYQSPMMSPSSGMGASMPMTSYQSPVMAPQYYQSYPSSYPR
jgi:beta-lactamase class A